MTASDRPTALVTGASRGIGKRTAISLARRGYDVAITARTVNEGDAALPGSLETTAREIEERGARAVSVPLDLLDLAALDDAVDVAVDGLGGRLDVLVNNAIYTGSGGPAMLLDAEPSELVNKITGNVIAPILITRRALHYMVAAGRGRIVNITSNVSQEVPPGPVGRGGWELAYSVSKAGFHRIADMVAVEYGDRGIRSLNINPGIVATEKLVSSASPEFLAFAESPEVVGEAIADLVDDRTVPNGGYVHAPDRAVELGLIAERKKHPTYQRIPAP
jgi:NAD(P)-dependent dehydrogenase (short-subunit alcohol dehydrogenase family)